MTGQSAAVAPVTIRSATLPARDESNAGLRSRRGVKASASAGEEAASSQMRTIFGTDTVMPPSPDYSPSQRAMLADAYAERVKTQMADVESGTEAERNVKYQAIRPFTTPAGYFSGGLLAAGYDPNQTFKIRFSHDVGMGRAQKQTDSFERTYTAWQIAAGVLEHDRPASGGTLNFDFMDVAKEDKSRVDELQATGKTLQDHWQQDMAGPAQDPSGALAMRSGKADAYTLRATLQSLASDSSFGKLSQEGQQAVSRTFNESGQVAIPNIYGYPIAGYAFIPYQPYDGNYAHRPNQGLMVDLRRGTVSEIRGDGDFAKWAQRNDESLRQGFNAFDREPGKDAHWPGADAVLDDLIHGNTVTYPGYSSLVTDKPVPVRQTFNYTGARSADYALQYGALTAGADGIAAKFQALNASNAKAADQTQVFGASQQNWKAAKEFWSGTFGLLPGIGNVGTLVFGVHDSVRGMTAQDRLGGNVAAVLSGLQLAHDLAPGAAELLGGAQPSVVKPSSTASWTYDAAASEFEFQAPALSAAASSGEPVGSIGSGKATGVQLNASNVARALPGLTPEGRKNAQLFFAKPGQIKAPVLRNPQDIENATRFFNEGGELGLKGGAGDGEGAGNGQRRPITAQEERTVVDYITRNPEASDRQVSADVGLTRSRVNVIRHRFGLQKTSGRGVFMSPQRRTEIADYIRLHPGETDAALGAACGVFASTIRNVRNSMLGPKFRTDWDALTPVQKNEVIDYIRNHQDLPTDRIATDTDLSSATIAKVRHALVAHDTGDASGAGPSTAPASTTGSTSRADSSPLLDGLDFDAPLTPGQQDQVDQIQRELTLEQGANGGAASGYAGTDHDRTSATTQPKTAGPAGPQPEAGPSGFTSGPGERTTTRTSSNRFKGRGRARFITEDRRRLVDYLRAHPDQPGAEIAALFAVSRGTISAFRNIFDLRRTQGAGVALTPERKAEINVYLRRFPDERASEAASRFGVSERLIRQMRQRNREQDYEEQSRSIAMSAAGPSRKPARRETAAGDPPVEPVDDAMDIEPMVDWILENMPLDQIESVSANLGHIQNELTGMSMSQHRIDATMRWILETLPLEEMTRIGQLSDDDFRREIEGIQQRMTLDEES
jgi:hypothetical protein